LGIVTMAMAARILENLGMETIKRHEQKLFAYLLERLREVPGLHVYGPSSTVDLEERVGIITFNLEGMPHKLVSAILGYEFGIATRSGMFCAHPYVSRLLGLGRQDINAMLAEAKEGRCANFPGAVRISLGLYNTTEDIDDLIEALLRIATGKYTGRYIQDPVTGEYQPTGFGFSEKDQIDHRRWFKV